MWFAMPRVQHSALLDKRLVQLRIALTGVLAILAPE
jgi:hypothetical protein